MTIWVVLLVSFLLFALYGYAASGDHWELHCEERLLDVGFIEVEESWRSCIWHAGLSVNPVVDVDDFNMSSPSVNLDAGWRLIGKGIEIDVPKGMGIYLGCQCQVDFAANVSSASGVADHVAPDALVRGALVTQLASVLKKMIYGARRTRSDLLHATKALARPLTKLAPRSEAQLCRSMCYMHSTAEHRMIGWVGGPLSALINYPYSDADLDHGMRVSGVLAVPLWDTLLGTTDTLQTHDGTMPTTNVCQHGQNPTIRHTGHAHGNSNARLHD